MKYKSLSLLIIALLSACTLGAQNRKKVGVVLSGGGAKGVAHIGALKVIEEAGIPIDYVVGTSMGALVGGLYSIGYTPQQLVSLIVDVQLNAPFYADGNEKTFQSDYLITIRYSIQTVHYREVIV